MFLLTTYDQDLGMQRVSDSIVEETFLLQAGYVSDTSPQGLALIAPLRWMELS